MPYGAVHDVRKTKDLNSLGKRNLGREMSLKAQIAKFSFGFLTVNW